MAIGVFVFCFLAFQFGCFGKFVDVTSSVFEDNQYALFVAFGDINADKLTDIFFLTSGNGISMLLSKQGGKVQEVVAADNSSTEHIVSVVPSDFNGDTRLDLLVCRQSQDLSSLHVQLYLARDDSNFNSPFTVATDLVSEPLVFDDNADMFPDLLAKTKDGKIEVFINNMVKGQKNFTRGSFGNKASINFTANGAHGFVDMNNDMSADIVFAVSNGYEIWLASSHGWLLNSTVVFSATHSVIGQASYIDMDLDGQIDIVVPVCEDADCQQSQLYVYSNSQWSCLMSTLSTDNTTFRYVTSGQLRDEWKIDVPITLRVGDYDSDGYPDALVLLTSDSPQWTGQRAFLLHNVPCAGPDKQCSAAQRTFALTVDPLLKSHTSVLLAAFFDLDEDGTLDIILAQSDNDTMFVALQNKYDPNFCFIKVSVGSGLCGGSSTANCATGRQPYGVNLPGRTTCYSQTNTEGVPQTGCAGILVQTAHLALQLPYVIFGLGETPSFVDSFQVGIPASNDNDQHSHEWTQLIPNSQLIVIPYPPTTPSEWTLKLSVTPSQLIYFVGIALLIVCGVVAIIVGALHLYEYNEDKKEKREEAHKFHFDAM